MAHTPVLLEHSRENSGASYDAPFDRVSAPEQVLEAVQMKINLRRGVYKWRKKGQQTCERVTIMCTNILEHKIFVQLLM